MRSAPRLLLILLLLAPAASRAAAEQAARLVGRVSVRGDGLYRVSQRSLQALGIKHPADVEVRRHGRPVPVCPSDIPTGLTFLARETAGPHSVYATFELWRPSGKPARPSLSDPAAQRRAATSRVLARDRVYGELAAAEPELYSAAAPVWFLAAVPHAQGVSLDLDPQGALPKAAQTLTALVYTNHRGPVVLSANWGGEDLGMAQVLRADGGARLSWTVPPQKVPEETTALLLRDHSPAPAPPPRHDVSAGRGVIYLDRLTLKGPVTDRPGTCLGAPRVVEAVPVRGRADPLATAANARHVILATPPLVEAAARLAAYRSSRGLPSAVVPVTQVYDRFGSGEASPLAIRRFLDALGAREGAPLEYVVLAGDATFNRTDLLREVTIPAPMGRTMYNGATAADRLYTRPKDSPVGGPAIGRLPFRKAAEMHAFVERVIRYESQPAAHASRRLLRFVTSEGRFGPLVDRLIEGKFRSVLAHDVPPAYDIEITFASPTSPFLWPPPEFNQKVIEGLNDGALFYTYVGHGYWRGFDTVHVGTKRYSILNVRDVPRISMRGTPPVVLVLACTTAWFDGTTGDGIGEALMKRPPGPIAYWGATRVCHPVYNAMVGEAVARLLARGGSYDRLGKILDGARDHVLTHPLEPITAFALRALSGVDDLQRLFEEGALMYTLLGDPALKIAFPHNDIAVEADARPETGEITARIRCDLPDGTKVKVSLELPRQRNAATPTTIANPDDPSQFEAIRRQHARMNDWALKRLELTLHAGRGEAHFKLEDAGAISGLIVKAWTVTQGEVHQGAARLPK